ncbi:uncharacterized protein PHACADRAFT_209585 [Phanerochaete carnosa HHB-10118-sp]|uniref:DUF1014-domain-containing protein n=1 Tax=Phanerochaete carnosa (strain HHB-10118-sp) TaxID=650164 RepID=K5VWZ1_PHACS|nr:uncharacterized protein PHACADRAFT_209585 [Phanerochaete carnosa HHB-10118-sp]EKM56088.1 hypothetical protein PHACADRAFT_209585 [Phanerochaete carnosa HHB-10118-sp]
MAPKGGNAKKESGRAKKAENEAKKQEAAAAEKEHREAEKWQDGPKSNKKVEDKEEKRKAELARKAENARILAEEEASAPKAKASPKAGAKKAASKAAPKPAGPGAIAAGGGLGPSVADVPKEEPESFSATGIDNALDLMETVTAKMDKASVGQRAAGIEQHPERRFKAAFEAYKEQELPNLKVERPGLRLAQYQEVLFKQFQKSPDNPFNQTAISYDASKEEKVEALRRKQEAVENRLRDRS